MGIGSRFFKVLACAFKVFICALKVLVCAFAVSSLFILTEALSMNENHASAGDENHASAGDEIDLIPLEVLFGSAEKAGPKLSPDGKYLAYLADFDGVTNIWVRTVGEDDDRPLTRTEGRGVYLYYWMYSGDTLYYRQDRDGDENFRFYAINVETGDEKLITPEHSEAGHPIMARGVGMILNMNAIPERPDEMLVALNMRDPAIHDLYLLNVRTGEMELIQESATDIASWLIDHTLSVRGYMRNDADGGSTLFMRSGSTGEYSEEFKIAAEDQKTTKFLAFTADNNGLYMIDSRGRNACALVRYDLESKEISIVAEDPVFDVDEAIFHPTKHTVEAVCFSEDRTNWRILDESVRADFDKLNDPATGDFFVMERTLLDDKWLVLYWSDVGPYSYHVYDREAREPELLFYIRDDIIGQPLTNMKPIKFTARDGLEIHGYLTLPLDWEGPGPMVLRVHGGPWARDWWGFNPEVQWLANRGYACLQVNFRGSTGYGKDFLNAGDLEWGGSMQDDLTDAVRWAVAEGIADEDKVVIYGMSWGG
ncbi:S9 family peptidase [bacterium]|nr:S9 family peptidase [bacterium]